MSLAPVIQKQLFRDAPFAWVMRNKAVVSSRYRRDDIAFFDRRMENYLCLLVQLDLSLDDGLQRIPLDDWGGVFVHTWLALEQSDDAALLRLPTLFTTPTHWEECVAALSYHSPDALNWALPLLGQHEAGLADNCFHASLAALGNQRMCVNREALEHALRSDNVRTLATALALVGDTRMNMNANMDNWCRHSDVSVRFHAIRTAVLSGETARCRELGEYIVEDNPLFVEALLLLMPLYSADEASRVVHEINQSTLSPRIKLWTMAISGLVKHIPDIIAWSQVPEYCRLAGEAFACITGVDIEEDDLSPLLEDSDLPVAKSTDSWYRDYEADLPVPGVDELRVWWAEHQHYFTAERYLMGLEFGSSTFDTVLNNGNQLQRRIAAVARALNDKTQVVFNVKQRAC